MKFGLDLICFFSNKQHWDIDFYLQCATLAEDAGWDGFFIWDHIWGYWEGNLHTVDPWILLSNVAAKTETIKLGPMVTPLARRRPWKVARETVTLDHLSDGRLILGVGLGGTQEEFFLFGEEANPQVRGEKLDEALSVITGLWTGEPFSFKGKHYQISEVTFLPPPQQKPRIPIWVGGFHPHTKPFHRAANFEGVFPTAKFGTPFDPSHLRQILTIIKQARGTLKDYEFVVT